jgi:predicted phosphoribosyltransferase
MSSQPGSDQRLQGPPFRDRSDAGRRLAESLEEYRDGGTIVFAIPRGGIPVAIEVARALDSRLDIIVSRKIPIPDNTEAGYGAVTEDGAIVLNDPLVRRLGLTPPQVERHAEAIRAEIRRRQSVFRAILPPSSVAGKKAVIIDDGLASGYTMLAAIRSLGRQGATRVVAAAPVASSHAWELLRASADAVVCPLVSDHYPFAVASFYRYWHDLTDEEVIRALEEYVADRGGGADA